MAARVERQLNFGPAVGDTTKVLVDVLTPGKRARHAWLVGGNAATNVVITQEQGSATAPVIVWSGVGVSDLVSQGFPVANQTTAILVQNVAGPHRLSLIVEYEFSGGCRVQAD
jgi:hypothetical protein